MILTTALHTMFEIFPWTAHLETSIAEIDEQHKNLVGLLNRLAQQHMLGVRASDLLTILAELADYAAYHFRTEERIWKTVLDGDEWFREHVEIHQSFAARIDDLRSRNRPLQAVLDELFSYLTRWLAFHILDSDKRMALAMQAVRAGLSVQLAHALADEQMRGATGLLIQTVLHMYQTVCSQAIDLMNEKLARQRAESALQNSEDRWRLLVGSDGTGEEPSVEEVLRTVVDNIPTGLVAADAATNCFLFANRWFCQMLGYPLEELLELGPLDIHPNELWPQVVGEFERMRTVEHRTALDIPVLRKDGSTFLARIDRVPVTLGNKASMLAIFTDVTERHRAEEALRHSESHLRTLLDTIPDLIWLKDPQGVYLSCNRAYASFLHTDEAGVIGKTDADFYPAHQVAWFRNHDEAALGSSEPLRNEEWVDGVEPKRVLFDTTKVRLLGAGSKLVGVLGIGRDVTERHEAAQTLDAERLRLQNAIDAAQAGTWEWDLVQGRVRFDGRSAAILGYPAEPPGDVSHDEYLALIHPEDRDKEREQMARQLRGETQRFELEMRLRHCQGHWVWCRSIGRVMQRDAMGAPVLVVGISIDISERKTHDERIAYLTHHDALTGLPNRKVFVELLDETIALCPRRFPIAVAYIDLDGFAAHNRNFGEEAANRLIVEIARRLGKAVGEEGFLAHIGGDEFAVMLPRLAHVGAYTAPVERVLAAVAQPLDVEGVTLTITASVGLAVLAHTERNDAEQLLRRADQAMYLAKQAGKNRHYVFDTLKDESKRERLLRIDEVRQALAANQFVLYYQPKVHFTSGRLVGFEALIRWQHPERGLLAPAAFIPLLDKHPLAIKLGDWVIEAALEQTARWNAQGMHTIVSVNIDAQQLLDPDFPQRLERQLGASPTVQSHQLQLEILETGALENIALVSALITRLHDMGVECALDDFGTGYSSLTFLKQLQARTLKIDQSFVRGMLDDAEHATIVNIVLGLARNFDRRVLAEGVETLLHGRALIEFGCEFGQGYAIARPMPASGVQPWITSWRAPEMWTHSRAVGPQDVPSLLAEVEHRAWCKQLRTAVQQRTQSPPQLDPNGCRFGQWLNRPATRQRFDHHPGFGSLQNLHQTLHQRAQKLLEIASAQQGGQVTAELAAVETLSQRLLDELRSLRSAVPSTGEIPARPQ
ncbi:EAL domain-containing protein [Candidatus Symbiobacter mobilis]|uniref:Signal transduction protein n=1 Tax=Candidatus Symbiobacter mobilis CR TaxID=946483 RepID=U5N6P8_9BURK|nr:EAL domain-containing protein [Candidatus Symbiobacter mobilis]AGX86955.1 signal transduction protein [Candidatus Symbiobacter mobilis CR]